MQEEKTGCGIACVAMLADASYAKARRVAGSIGIFAGNPKLWSDTEFVRKLSAEFDIELSKMPKPFKAWDKLPPRALLATKWHMEGGTPFWHWSVFVRDGQRSHVLDPKKGLKSNKRTDFGRIKPKWFAEVLL